MGKKEDIWYAVNATRVVYSPDQTIESFGTTTIRYHLVSELLDHANKVRVRAGSVYSERPQILTPSMVASQLLDGFGDKATEYAEWLLEHGEIIRILRYGLHFRKETVTEELINGSVDDVVQRVTDQVREADDQFAAVVVGADELWEVSLLKFLVDYIQTSSGPNFQELAHASAGSGARADIRRQLEADFTAAASDGSRLEALGNKLQKLGLFDDYEDRFFAMVRRLN